MTSHPERRSYEDMRVVVKPAGLMLIIAMIGVLAVLAFMKKRPASPTAAVAGVIAPAPGGNPTNNNLLKNPGFENGIFPASLPSQNQKAAITGHFARDWRDNSEWAEVSVNYEADSQNPHEGKTSQRLEITDLQTGHAQFIQEVATQNGTTYRATLWARASAENTPVEFLLREAGGSYKPYKSVTASVGTQWQQLTVEGKVTEPGPTFVMIILKTPDVKLWLDDAALEAVD